MMETAAAEAGKLSRYVESVREFHSKAGHLINTVPRQVAAGVTVQRQRLIMEELGETASAWHDRKMIEFADGLGDLLYVIAGTAVVYGVRITAGWSDALEKRFAPILPVRFCPYEVAQQLLAKISKAVSRLFMAMAHFNLESIHTFLCELIEATFELAFANGIPLPAIFTEVHESNMSKNLAPCDGIQKYAQPHLVKGPGYHPPDIETILNWAGDPKLKEEL